MRRGVLERLEDRGDKLAAEVLPARVSPVHAATVSVLSELLSMGSRLSATGETPTHLRVLMRTLERSRGVLLDSIAGVPADSIRAFMGELAARIQTIVDAPEQ